MNDPQYIPWKLRGRENKSANFQNHLRVLIALVQPTIKFNVITSIRKAEEKDFSFMKGFFLIFYHSLILFETLF